MAREYLAGRLEVKVNGGIVDSPRVSFNGVPEIKISESNIPDLNGIYRKEMDGIICMVERAARKEYSPGILRRMFGAKMPSIKVSYIEA